MVGLVSSFFPLFTSKAGELKDGGVLGLDDTRIIWNLMELLRLYIYIYTHVEGHAAYFVWFDTC